MSAVKQQAHALIENLPDEANWDDVLRAVDDARFRDAVAAGTAAADRGDFASPDRVREMFARWGADASS